MALRLTLWQGQHPGSTPLDGGALACGGQAALGQLGSARPGSQPCTAARPAVAAIAAESLGREVALYLVHKSPKGECYCIVVPCAAHGTFGRYWT